MVNNETCQVTSLQKDNKIGMLSKLRSVLTSYLAYSSKANSFRIVRKHIYRRKNVLKQRFFRRKNVFCLHFFCDNVDFK